MGEGGLVTRMRSSRCSLAFRTERHGGWCVYVASLSGWMGTAKPRQHKRAADTDTLRKQTLNICQTVNHTVGENPLLTPFFLS